MDWHALAHNLHKPTSSSFTLMDNNPEIVLYLCLLEKIAKISWVK
jgi:hypothetical protein